MIWDKLLLVAVGLLALGLWLLLPGKGPRLRAVGAMFALVSLGLFASRLTPLGHWVGDCTFYVLASVALIACVGTVSMRSPVYCAIWFALALLAIGGLILFQGAQFLGVATVAVYAGAILVTFLFVLMLAQPEGHTYYDRISWEALGSALAGSLLVGVLSMTTASVFDKLPGHATPAEATEVGGVLADDHVAGFGAVLFSEQLIAVQVVGILLLVALVGAAAIAARKKSARANIDSSAQGAASHG